MGCGVWEKKERKWRKKKKKVERENCLLPCSGRAGFASLVLWREVKPLQRTEQFQDKRFCWAESTSVTLLSHPPRSAVIPSWISRKPHCNHSIEYHPEFFFKFPYVPKCMRTCLGLATGIYSFGASRLKFFLLRVNKTKQKSFSLWNLCVPRPAAETLCLQSSLTSLTLCTIKILLNCGCSGRLQSSIINRHR